MHTLRLVGHAALSFVAFFLPLGALWRYIETGQPATFWLCLVGSMVTVFLMALLWSLLAVSSRISERDRQEGREW
jgi:uncharacterized membrane protein